jgi:hypothetical protein
MTDLFHLQEDLDASQFELMFEKEDLDASQFEVMFEKEFLQTIALQATIAYSSKIVDILHVFRHV